MTRSSAEIGRKTVSAELMADGVHLVWVDEARALKEPPWGRDPVGVWRHEIVLKVHRSDFLRDGGPSVGGRPLVRIRSFAYTTVTPGSPKELQKRREKLLSSRPEEVDGGDVADAVRVVVGVVKDVFSADLEKDRRELREALARAHDLLSFDDITSIFNEVLAEHTMRA